MLYLATTADCEANRLHGQAVHPAGKRKSPRKLLI